MSKSILSAWVWNIDRWEYYIRSICETEVDVFWMKKDYYFGYELAAEDEAVIDNVVIKVGKSWPGIKFKGRYKKAGGSWVTFLTDHELTFEDDLCCHGEEKKVTLPGPGSDVKFRGKFLLEYTLTDLGDAPHGYDALPVPLVTGDIPPTAIYGTVVTNEGKEGRLRDDSPLCSPPDTRCVSGWLYECGGDHKWYLKAKTCPPPTKPGTTLTCHDATTEEGSSVELSATLKDEDGNPLEGETVKFTLQGKTYSDTTDSSGIATVTVPAADVPSAGEYTWTAEYEGNDYESSSCAGTLTVTTAPPCTEGDTKCIGYNLYECRAGRWELKERNSPECGYTPPIPCPIACVCAGTELVDCLGPIREFRDKTLKSTRPGRKFVDIYYNWLTPLLSPVLMKSAVLRKIGQQVVKLLLLLLNNDRRGKGDHQG